MAREVIARSLSVRETESLVKTIVERGAPTREPAGPSPPTSTRARRKNSSSSSSAPALSSPGHARADRDRLCFGGRADPNLRDTHRTVTTTINAELARTRRTKISSACSAISALECRDPRKEVPMAKRRPRCFPALSEQTPLASFAQVLSDIPAQTDDRVPCRLQDRGRAVYGGRAAALVHVDFFTPIVDDRTPTARSPPPTPSATSTRWADVLTALAIAAFPKDDLEPGTIRAIFRAASTSCARRACRSSVDTCRTRR